jgi:phosphoglycolate phosphatase-like HAD superfamily hydrolase
MDRWLGLYVAGIDRVSLATDADAALTSAAAQGWTQSILSMHRQSELRAHVEAMGIRRFFTAVDGTGDDVGAGALRTKAELLAAHLNRLGVAPQQTVMIGDMTDDADAALAVGASTVLTATGDTSRARLEATGRPVATTLTEAAALAGSLLSPFRTRM